MKHIIKMYPESKIKIGFCYPMKTHFTHSFESTHNHKQALLQGKTYLPAFTDRPFFNSFATFCGNIWHKRFSVFCFSSASKRDVTFNSDVVSSNFLLKEGKIIGIETVGASDAWTILLFCLYTNIMLQIKQELPECQRIVGVVHSASPLNTL